MRSKKKVLVTAGLALLAFIAILGVAGSGKITAVDRFATDDSDRPSWESDDSGAVVAGDSENDSMIWPLLKLAGALTLVIGGIYGFLFLLRKMMGARLSSNRQNQLIEVVETAYIAQKKSVSLIRFADRAVLVGVAENGISALAELSPEETAEISSGMETKKAAGFKNIFSRARGKYINIAAGKGSSIEGP
jgi:flagellar biosynthetic protein FliO